MVDACFRETMGCRPSGWCFQGLYTLVSSWLASGAEWCWKILGSRHDHFHDVIWLFIFESMIVRNRFVFVLQFPVGGRTDPGVFKVLCHEVNQGSHYQNDYVHEKWGHQGINYDGMYWIFGSLWLSRKDYKPSSRDERTEWTSLFLESNPWTRDDKSDVG